MATDTETKETSPTTDPKANTPDEGPGTIKLYNQNDGINGRDGGPYLDQLEMIEAEKRRAVIEDREPDFDNPGPTAGVNLVPANQLAPHYNQVGTRFDTVHGPGTGLFSEETAPPVFAEIDVPDLPESNILLPPGPGELSPSASPKALREREQAENGEEPAKIDKPDNSSLFDSTDDKNTNKSGSGGKSTDGKSGR